VRDVVASRQRDELVDLLERARVARLGLPGRSTRPAGEVVELRIPVPNREGVLADVTTLASRMGVNIEALETADATEHERGLIVMVVEAAAGRRLRDALSERGYRPVVRALE
jgi:prephenate dehydrogenase